MDTEKFRSAVGNEFGFLNGNIRCKTKTRVKKIETGCRKQRHGYTF